MSEHRMSKKPVPQDAPRMTVRVEFVGIIAVACLIIGVIIGNSRMLSHPAPPTTAQAQTQDVSQAGLDAMLAQVDKIDDFAQLVDIGNQASDSNPHLAIAAYEKALRINPNDPDVITDLGAVYHDKLHDYNRSEALFRQAIALDPKHAISRFNLGTVLTDRKDYKGAEAAYREFLKLQPTGDTADEARKRLKNLEEMAK
jgi:Flp pilus assembly protein TadD